MSVIRNTNNRYINRKGILFFILLSIILTPFIFLLTIPNDIKSNNDNLPENDSKSFKTPKTSGNDINITTPENRTYYGPMSGYYPATYGFENDAIGTSGIDIKFVDIATLYDGSLEIVESWQNHKNVLRLQDDVTAGEEPVFGHNMTATSSGTIEFYIGSDNVAEDWNIVLLDMSTPAWIVILHINSNKLYYQSGGGDVEIQDFYNNTFYNIRIVWYTNDTFDVYVNEALMVDGVSTFGSQTSGIDTFGISCSGDSENYIYLDAVGLITEDPSYTLGDNHNEGLLLSFENNTNLDWIGYSLDGDANKTILGNTTIPMPVDGSHTIQVFGNNTIGTIYQSDVRYFSVSSINIITPENKTYYEPMSGYYPATYGFECDANGAVPKEWVDTSPSPSLATVESSQAVFGHHSVLNISDNGVGSAIVTNDYPDQSNGTIEFYWLSTDVNERNQFHIRRNETDPYIAGIMMHFNHFEVFTGGVWEDVGRTATANAWYHIRIDFESTGGGYQGLNQWKWQLFINGIKYGPYDFVYNKIPNRLTFHLRDPTWGYNLYVDALGFSWDPNYNVGDNLEEGLLLSFDNSTTLDWMGYSLDGQANKTILGNTTIPMPANGPHRIQVFSNDSLGTMYQSDVRYFRVDEIPLPPPPPDDNDDGKDGEEEDFEFWLLIILLLILIIIGIIAVAGYVIKYKGKTELKQKIKPPEKEKFIRKPKRRKKKRRLKRAKQKGYINCPFCYNNVMGSEQFCPYCGSPLSEITELLEPTGLIGLAKKKLDFYDEDDYYEKIFLQSSNILKIWIFDSKSKSKIYEETLEPNFTRIEQKHIDITNIIKADYEKNKIIEESFEFENNIIYLYIYESINPIIFVLFSGKKFDKDYLEFIVNTIKGIDENYQYLKEDPLEMKQFLDENIFLFNSRKYNQISTIKKVLLNKIFKVHKVRDEILKEIPKLPVGTFEEFLRLYELLTEELKFAKTIDAINNTDYFEEGGFK